MNVSACNPKSWTFIQRCGAISLACAAWNLFGDLYFMDFYTVHLSLDEFGMVSENLQSGNLFDFNKHNWWIVFVAQAGGWMYPIWAFVTAVPVYVGLHQNEENFPSHWIGFVPFFLLAYGMCVVGGGLHSAFAFLTILPSVYHHPIDVSWSDLVLGSNEEFSLFIISSQSRIIQLVGIGCFPGILACNIAFVWIAFLTCKRYGAFPRCYILFNPIVTSIWVQIMASVLPDPAGFYFAGCLGTWGIMIFNIGTIYYLWSKDTEIRICLSKPKDKALKNEMSGTAYQSVEDAAFA